MIRWSYEVGELKHYGWLLSIINQLIMVIKLFYQHVSTIIGWLLLRFNHHTLSMDSLSPFGPACRSSPNRSTPCASATCGMLGATLMDPFRAPSLKETLQSFLFTSSFAVLLLASLMNLRFPLETLPLETSLMEIHQLKHLKHH